MAEKSEAAFRTIREVADALELPAHVLRFWEAKFPQIRPLKRAGGRRFYRPEDVALLRRIRALLYQEGYTIKGVQRVLGEEKAGKAANAGRQSELLLDVASAAVNGEDREERQRRLMAEAISEIEDLARLLRNVR